MKTFKFIPLLSIMFLSACSTPTSVIMYPVLPESITSPCTVQKVDLKTNQDLLYEIIDLKQAYAICSLKQKALADSISKQDIKK